MKKLVSAEATAGENFDIKIRAIDQYSNFNGWLLWNTDLDLSRRLYRAN